MKIVSLQAQNFKRLKAVEIKPDGSLVVISGKNAQGKSSVLDSIFAALGGADALPSKPIRKGEQSARIKLDLGEIIVTRKFTQTGSTVVVEQANGARFNSPQTMLSQLIGSIAFDPLEFTRMKAADQFGTLRKLVPLEVDIDALDGQNKTDYDARTDVNREAKALRAQAAGIPIVPDLPDEPINTDAILQAMQEAGEANAMLEKRKAGREQAKGDLSRLDAEVKRLQAAAAALREQADAADKEAAATKTSADAVRKKLADAPALPAPIDVSKFRAEIAAADAVNEKIADRESRQSIEARAEAKEAEAAKLTEAMAARTAAKETAIKAAKMPIDGLTFGDGEVLYQDLPLDQASQAERIRVSMAVAMALNPKLRVLTIKDGSLIDADGMKVIQKMIADGDYQLWLERVGTDGNIGVIIEDGAVVAQAEAIPQDAA